MTKKKISYIDNRGTFRLENADMTSGLYFPLANEAGMMSAVTPELHGDLKTGHNNFILEPISIEDLHNKRSARNFWIIRDNMKPWSATGNSSWQKAGKYTETTEKCTVEAGFLWHKAIRENSAEGLSAEVTTYVPAEPEKVELTRTVIKNISGNEITFAAVSAVPIYGRSADDLRDHRHVTSLLNRIYVKKDGIIVNPTLSFDERGHRINSVSYGVLGYMTGGDIVGAYPVAEEYLGEGGSYEWPETIVSNKTDCAVEGDYIEGYEAVGAIRFSETKLMPGETKTYITAIFSDDDGSGEKIRDKYLTETGFDFYLSETEKFWEDKLSSIAVSTGDKDFDRWMNWVKLQPVLRRIYGCSFLPHHDYGRGGRGWRDLWQDCLALLLMEPNNVKYLLKNNFAGVRIDGTNATIIGSQPGEFVADRNNIPRVWMDHGAWPLLTTKLYLDMTGDLGFLLEEQAYFKDSLINRARSRDALWNMEQGGRLKDTAGNIYTGSILEHIILQNVSAFYNSGEHNNIRLEGADWNDAFDMARDKGESVAFSAMYGWNLMEIAEITEKMSEKLGIQEIPVSEEMVTLIDPDDRVDYNSYVEKNKKFAEYCSRISHTVTGRKVNVNIGKLVKDLREKGTWLINFIRENEYITNNEGFSWFNGYYDNKGMRVEGDNPNGVRMTLTGQVFTIMGGTAADEQVMEIIKSADRYLFDLTAGGYRLNTDFKEVKLDMGRGFGFAFGHKENGAMFSHMSVMYANALYKRGYAEAGYKVIESIYSHLADFEKGRIYPGIPEYISNRGRGMYNYLTGSASWLLLTEICQIFGVRGEYGDLVIEPKLLSKQFDVDGNADVKILFAGKNVTVRYENKDRKSHGEYKIKSVTADGAVIDKSGKKAVVPRGMIELVDSNIEIKVVLG